MRIFSAKLGGLLILLSLGSTQAIAQDDNCITDRQFLRGEFTPASKPCDESLQIPIEYCTAVKFSRKEIWRVYPFAEFGGYLISPLLESKASDMRFVDSARLKALTDDEVSEDFADLFFYLYSALLSALVYDFAGADSSERRDILVEHADLESIYFPFGIDRSSAGLKRAAECTVRCGSKNIKATRLTRSQIFQQCLGEE
ncbi:MAG: hypothetical protein V3U96_11985 [Paracoccaceae bacterium]